MDRCDARVGARRVVEKEARRGETGREAFGADWLQICQFLLNSAQSSVNTHTHIVGVTDFEAESEGLLVEYNTRYIPFNCSPKAGAGLTEQEVFELPLKTTEEDQEEEVTEIRQQVTSTDECRCCSVNGDVRRG